MRFQLPRRVCESAATDLLVVGITGIDGVTAVRIYRRAGKLSIRYLEQRCRFIDLAKQLYKIVSELEQQGHFSTPSAEATAANPKLGLKQRFSHSCVGRWFDQQLLAAKETAQAAKIIGKLSTKGPKALIKNPEKAVIDFLNDILVLYLIKTHWGRITQQWLPKPFAHRYEWLATFYLFFLLVRSRRPK